MYGILELIVCVFVGCGVLVDDVLVFFDLMICSLMFDFLMFIDCDKVVVWIVEVVMCGECVVIFGDYDVDGVLLFVLFYCFLIYFGVEVIIYILDCIFEGYGLNLVVIG